MTLPKAQAKPIRFFKGGVLHTLHDVAPDRTLLEVLREDLHQTGTKEGCGEGDCGACTVVVGSLQAGKLQTRAVNSCIKLAHSVDGMALWTVEDLSAPDGRLHPAQEALLQCHGSQCGFCTPGFVMSMAALCEQAGDKPISRDIAQQALSGNLCRCTGYRPILDAACRMQTLPKMPLASKVLHSNSRTWRGPQPLKPPKHQSPLRPPRPRKARPACTPARSLCSRNKATAPILPPRACPSY